MRLKFDFLDGLMLSAMMCGAFSFWYAYQASETTIALVAAAYLCITAANWAWSRMTR